MRVLLCTTLLLCGFDSAHANDLNWNSAGAEILFTDYSALVGDSVDGGIGFGAFARQQIQPNLFVHGRLTTNRISNPRSLEYADIRVVSVGLGYRYDVTGDTDVFGSFAYRSIDTTGAVDPGRDGVSLGAGLRSMLSRDFELAASIKSVSGATHLPTIDRFTELNTSMSLYLQNDIIAGLAYTRGYFTESFSLSLRYVWGSPSFKRSRRGD